MKIHLPVSTSVLWWISQQNKSFGINGEFPLATLNIIMRSQLTIPSENRVKLSRFNPFYPNRVGRLNWWEFFLYRLLKILLRACKIVLSWFIILATVHDIYYYAVFEHEKGARCHASIAMHGFASSSERGCPLGWGFLPYQMQRPSCESGYVAPGKQGTSSQVAGSAQAKIRMLDKAKNNFVVNRNKP